MDLRQLKTFRAVAELGSLSKASDHLRTAQPALSRQIRLLEHELRTPLFVRHGRGMAPTEAGKVLFERTDGLVRQLEQARDDVMAASGEVQGLVVLGMIPTISSALALTIARRVLEAYPHLHLRMLDAYGNYLVDYLHRGEIDMAVVSEPARGMHLDCEILRQDLLLNAVGPIGSGLSERKMVTLEWLAAQPLVLPGHPHSARLIVDEAAAACHMELQVQIEANSFQALVDLVKGGLGLTLMPYFAAAPYVAAGQMEACPVSPSIKRGIVLALPVHHQGSRAAGLVADIVREEVRRLVG